MSHDVVSKACFFAKSRLEQQQAVVVFSVADRPAAGLAGSDVHAVSGWLLTVTENWGYFAPQRQVATLNKP